MSFNEALKKARKAKGLTQDDVAQALGTKNTTVSNWERSSPFLCVNSPLGYNRLCCQ